VVRFMNSLRGVPTMSDVTEGEISASNCRSTLPERFSMKPDSEMGLISALNSGGSGMPIRSAVDVSCDKRQPLPSSVSSLNGLTTLGTEFDAHIQHNVGQ
jgi:hypothetical protein